MTRTQTLSSGLLIQQDFSAAVRSVLFQTEYEEFLYATHGGTLFVVSFLGRFYGLTCKHVFQDFDPGTLYISQQKYAQKGSMPSPLTGLCFPSAPTGEAVGSDIDDICVIEFSDDIAQDFFKDKPYIIDKNTIGTSKFGNEIHVCGVLKDKTEIIPPYITMGFARLILRDEGVFTSDPFLRVAKAEFTNPAFETVTGISGSPVFDNTDNVLCGMVARGGMIGNQCIIHYIDIFDIFKVLEGVSTHAASGSYTKIIRKDDLNRRPLQWEV